MTTDEKSIRNCLGSLNLAHLLGIGCEACRAMGRSRDCLYWIEELCDVGGEMALEDIRRRKPIPQNRVSYEIEELALDDGFPQSVFGSLRVSNELKKMGFAVSPSGVCDVWLRHDMETFKKRIEALEAEVAPNTIVIAEEKLQVLK